MCAREIALDTLPQAEQRNLHTWVAAVEALGFVFLRHQALQRSHALAFVTAPLSDAEVVTRTQEARLPDMPLRRELADHEAVAEEGAA